MEMIYKLEYAVMEQNNAHHKLLIQKNTIMLNN